LLLFLVFYLELLKLDSDSVTPEFVFGIWGMKVAVQGDVIIETGYGDAIMEAVVNEGDVIIESPTLLKKGTYPSVLESLEPGVGYSVEMPEIDLDMALFYPKSETSQQLAKELETPSFHFLEEPQRAGVIPAQWSVYPQFQDTNDKFGVQIQLEEGSHCYGGGEQANRLCLNNTQWITWNTDCPAYGTETMSLYQTHPFVLVLRKDGSTYGVIVNTTFPLLFDISDSQIKVLSYTQTPSPVPFSVLIFEAQNPQEVTCNLGKMTGLISLPPKWSIGYHQCRWSYYPDTRAMEVAKTFREKEVPCDVIWFDIHYMNGYRIFTFDPYTFSNPKSLNEKLHDQGFHSVWMIDPGVKKETGYSVYDQCIEQDLAVRLNHPTKEDSAQKFYEGTVWPGSCVFPDFTMEQTRTWWASLYKDFMAEGVDGVWNDMNEPAVMATPPITMDRTAWHRGYGGGFHERFHNVYGYLMIQASKEGIMKANPTKRPFLLSRANFLGGQRFGATWTGDNISSWPHLALSIPMVLNLGISGQPFSGPDIGGFMNNADGELFARWMGFGALFPFARAHTHEDTSDHEPWSFGEKCSNTCKDAITRRYRLLPFMYTLFYQASKQGLPVARPLFFLDPRDQALRNEDRAFMLGDTVLVIPNVAAPGESCQGPINIPKNHLWYDLDLDGIQDPDLPQMKIRGGSILVAREPEQYVGEKPLTKLIVYVALNEEGSASGELYLDQGEGYQYQSGEYLLVKFSAKVIDKQFTMDLVDEGTFPRPFSSIELHVLQQTDEPRTVPILSNTISFQM
jgi:alpha-glucosidase